ncbi:MAG: glycosyltransferase family 2 protein [Planctomycetia bacterium]|nr:glycosyltransferase family 2 protein [Planctomycetia bacterium]
MATDYDLDIGLIYTYEDAWMLPIVRSLAASGPGLRMRLLLVDNASERGTEPWTKEFPKSVVIRNERRLGYAENLNRILERSIAKYALLLNTDMFFDPREACLTKLVRFMDANPECGLSTCRIYRYDNSYAFGPRRYPSLRGSIGRRFEDIKLFHQDVDDSQYRDRDPYATFACDWFTGCLFFARSEAVNRVGPLDAGFKKYYEDVDWCGRFNNEGYQVVHYGGTYCFHAEQRSSKRIFSPDGRKHLQSYARWLWKWRSRPRSAGEFFQPAAATNRRDVELPQQLLNEWSLPHLISANNVRSAA